jgi:hypothetical protein
VSGAVAGRVDDEVVGVERVQTGLAGLQDSLGEVSQRAQRPGGGVDLFQRVGRVGLVDEDELAAAERRVVDLVGRVDQLLPPAVGQPVADDGVGTGAAGVGGAPPAPRWGSCRCRGP